MAKTSKDHSFEQPAYSKHQLDILHGVVGQLSLLIMDITANEITYIMHTVCTMIIHLFCYIIIINSGFALVTSK